MALGDLVIKDRDKITEEGVLDVEISKMERFYVTSMIWQNTLLSIEPLNWFQIISVDQI
jgi:hypothetical protein